MPLGRLANGCAAAITRLVIHQLCVAGVASFPFPAWLALKTPNARSLGACPSRALSIPFNGKQSILLSMYCAVALETVERGLGPSGKLMYPSKGTFEGFHSKMISACELGILLFSWRRKSIVCYPCMTPNGYDTVDDGWRLYLELHHYTALATR